jgi:hypothetical protein
MTERTGKNKEGSRYDLVKALSWYLPGRAKDNH